MERHDEVTDVLIDLGDVNVETKGPLEQLIDERGGVQPFGLTDN